MPLHYTTLSDARKKLEKRQKNGIREEVEYLWKRNGYEFPMLPKTPDLAILARQVATARFEDFAFRELALKGDLSPLWFEGTGDIFSSASAYKRSLLNPYVCMGSGKSGPIVAKKKLASVTRNERVPLRDIPLDDGSMSIVEYHRKNQDSVLGSVLRVDTVRPWKKDEKARDYYHWYLSLFLAHGILFEDFHGGESGTALDTFTQNVFEPGFSRITSMLSLEPIIVRMPWKTGMQYYPVTDAWDSYGVIDRQYIEARAAELA